jgi:hypothetical protein
VQAIAAGQGRIAELLIVDQRVFLFSYRLECASMGTIVLKEEEAIEAFSLRQNGR